MDLEEFIRVQVENGIKAERSTKDICTECINLGVGFYVGNALAVERMEGIKE